MFHFCSTRRKSESGLCFPAMHPRMRIAAAASAPQPLRPQYSEASIIVMMRRVTDGFEGSSEPKRRSWS